jgi:hypothetical protein
VIVAVAVVGVVKVPVDDVIGVVAVGDRFVPAVLAVRMGSFVASARVRGRAIRRVRAADAESVLVDVIAVHVVQVPVVEEVLVAVVLDGLVTAIRSVNVLVLVVRLVLVTHRFLLQA